MSPDAIGTNRPERAHPAPSPVARPLALDVPAYLADLLRDLTGQRERVTNAGGLFMDPQDGIALAGAALRKEIQDRFPGCWGRLQQRRTFMQQSLGVALDQSVLPLGNMPAWLPPYVLDLEMALVV